MSTIYQGDQYYIPFRIDRAGKVVTPLDVDGLKIVVGSVVQSYPDGVLSFDGDENWLFRLDAESSRHMSNSVCCQIEIQTGGNLEHSSAFYIDVKKSIVRGETI